MRRLGTTILLTTACLAATACGGSTSAPSIDDIAARWPQNVAVLRPAEPATAEHYEKVFLPTFKGASSIDFYDLPDDSLGMGVKSVLVVRGDRPFSAAQVNQFGCDYVLSFTKADGSRPHDSYVGKDGLHGENGTFSINVDGVAVLVTSTVSTDDARAIARALGGTDDSEPACGPSDSHVRIAG